MATALDNPHIERKSLCLPSSVLGVALHSTDSAFSAELARLYSSPESDATESLMQLKMDLKSAEAEPFWTRLMEGMTEICGAQYGFVAKRILVEDHNCAV